MAAPIPYRTSSNNLPVGSFPPNVYYRDTYGLQHLIDGCGLQRNHADSITTMESDDTVTTKSTVRTTANIHNVNQMNESSTSKGTVNSPSFHIDQVVTNQVVLMQARTLLTLTLVAFGAALQLMIFGIICVFYDGCPYYLAVIASILFMLNASTVLCFIRYRPTRKFLMLCIAFTIVSFIVAVAIFIWTAYLIYGEDKQIRGQGWSFYEENFLELNRIVSNTRVAMYSLHMVLSPIQALCCAGILNILFKNLRHIQTDRITRGYFFTQPLIGQQTVLVPIELKQVETFDESETENASVGVQTSGGNQSNKDSF
ncbi:hypothetical protein LOAG_04467 [Loa loa]|uniref:Transmembrane protein n=2 Tax=Loa loa TaxID=7209 RepID=A0A1S0U1T6_LOALO|nr:hypothetical protein LOAG_04467 [Loa loa]EFO24015.2 hypothetical protein LOAG_04467 [Loa loa]